MTKAEKKLFTEIGDRARAIRILRGLTKEEFAAKIGISAQSLSFFENGNKRVSAFDLVSIARALDVHTSVLIGEIAYSEQNAA